MGRRSTTSVLYSRDVDLPAEAIRLARQLAAKTEHEEVAALLTH
jgi:hypothetical protein